ncbi:ribonuclease [Pseudomonas phage 9Ps-7B]|uniref:ribonuclease H n=1 Tax=Pseudomonas phage vB_PaeM_FBPa36 TaxID=3231237 RepID=A0AAU8KWD1_9VIRU|nr:ribonuclease HI [Pseudomonas phage pPA-N1803-4At.2]WPJ69310.1 ribonuclease H [Pseudomonas phage PA_ZH1]WRQ05680.1 ribonuclease [Pseudomonas phage 6B]WRQ06177.1 ribonuclease [Pseudomonas phage 9-Ps-8B]WRQ06585.1 ribonuclease [Pseudomonas phage 9Ps-7B]WRQ06936.1 ribonuclease [Pseudomonas phage 14Ps5-6]BDR26951.1 hypothetical protein RVBP20_1920 [Pseudomonas phage sp. NK1]
MADGMVLYTDGSFRQGKAGWGIHGYTYENVAMKSKAATKQQPTAKGYLDVGADETCTVLNYIDAFGSVTNNPTNNTGELTAAIEAFKIAHEADAPRLTMLMDSEYVRKGMTAYLPKWIKSNWIKSDGTPVANQDLWKQMVELKAKWEETNKPLSIQWVRGHNGDIGNEKADANAKLGSGQNNDKPVMVSVKGEEINKLKKQVVNPLILESRLLFAINSGEEPDGFYYTYNLGRMHNYGHKPKDTAKDKLAKADLILGRRISEATFSVYKANEPDEYLQLLINMHTEALGTENPELGIINLANAYRATIRQKIESMGLPALVVWKDINVLSTPTDELISRTLNPPRMANDAVATFNVMRSRLEDYLAGKLGESVGIIDITEHFFEEVAKGKKVGYQLLKTITSNTGFVEVPITFKDRKIKLKLVLNIDIPSRNQLARIGANKVKMEILVVAEGPYSYSYSIVFVTDDGSAIYQSPYTQFILPK